VICRGVDAGLEPKDLGRVCSAMTTSSREVLPARSPMPLTVTSTWRAPAWMPARVLAWPAQVVVAVHEMITARPMPGVVLDRMPAMSSPNSHGVV
jgi:hypothetical protein